MALRSIDMLSICTGGAGLDLGIELALPGARSVCMVEREAFAVAQLVSAMEAGHLDPAPVWSDVRTFDGRPWRGLVDGLIGGIPCQPHSLAGRKRGQLDGRDLWSDARRIISTARPWFVLIENVSGMLSAGADEIAGAERVWRDLRKLGFAVEGGLFTAAEVGASHERERVFILGVADAGCLSCTGRRGAGDMAGAARDGQGEGHQWERDGDAADNRSDPLADTRDARLQGRELGGPFGERDGSQASGSVAELRRAPLEHSPLIGRGEGRSEPSLRSGWDTAAGADSAVVDAISGGRAGRPDDAIGSEERRAAAQWPIGLDIFPPGPSDLSGWRAALDRAPELEPAFRRVADGLASRLGIARVDRLRLLGNGVVPLAAAHAFRTLATRLSDSGAPGADRLVRSMRIAA